VAMRDSKVQEVMEYYHIQNLYKMCGFLGLTRYYKCFFKSYVL